MLKIIDERKVLSKNFRIYGDFENPLFRAKDVAMWIDYGVSNVSKMVKTIDEDEKILARTNNTSALFLTEYGLYEVLMQSRKPIAKQFKKEVKHILKEIRQTGKYEKPKQQILDLNNRLYFELFTVLTIKGLSELSGIDEVDIRYAISKLNLRPMLLREDSLEEFKERNRISFKHVSQLTILGFNECKQILKLFKKDHLISLLKEYFNDNNKVKVIETTQDKDVNVKMLGKCIELYDELIDMDIKKIYELKTDLFTNKNYPQHIKKLIFRVFNTVELKKLNI